MKRTIPLIFLAMTLVLAGCDLQLSMSGLDGDDSGDEPDRRIVNITGELADKEPESLHPEVIYETNVLASDGTISDLIDMHITEWLDSGGIDPSQQDGEFDARLEYMGGNDWNALEIVYKD